MSIDRATQLTAEGVITEGPGLIGYSVEKSSEGGWTVGVLVPGKGRVVLETRLTKDSANFWMGTYALPQEDRARTVYLVAAHSGEDGFEDYVVRVEIASNATDPDKIAAVIRQGYRDVNLPSFEPVIGALAITVDQKSDPLHLDLGLAASHRALEAALYLPQLFSGYPADEIMEALE